MEEMKTAMRNRNAPHIDFGFLMGKIKKNEKFLPSDLDMIAHRGKHFFIAEWKAREEGKSDERLSIGQEILLKALAKLENFDIYLIYYKRLNKDPWQEIIEFKNMSDEGDKGWCEKQFIETYRKWYDKADKEKWKK